MIEGGIAQKIEAKDMKFPSIEGADKESIDVKAIQKKLNTLFFSDDVEKVGGDKSFDNMETENEEFPLIKEEDKEGITAKAIQTRLNDLLFSDDIGNLESDGLFYNKEENKKSDLIAETKEGSEPNKDQIDSSGNRAKDFENKDSNDRMENASTSSETDKGMDLKEGTGEKKHEQKDLSFEEINEQQKKEIEEAAKRIARGEKLTDAEKGNLGEMLMDQYYISQGYKPIHEPRVTSLEHKSGKGIDGVYEKTNPDGTKSYVIGEAKVNSSRLNKGLADGTDQMSDQWVENRLDQAVGKEKADEIRDAYEDNPESVSKEVYHFSYSEDGSGKADVSTVDDSGNQNKSEVVQIFDKNGNEVQGGVQNDQR